MSKMHIKLEHENFDNKTVEMTTKPKKSRSKIGNVQEKDWCG